MAAYDNTAIFERKREIDENLFGQKLYVIKSEKIICQKKVFFAFFCNFVCNFKHGN